MKLSYEKQGTFMNEWSMNTKWINKLTDIFPTIYPTTQLYRRSNLSKYKSKYSFTYRWIIINH